jgi:hypothetical protein
MVTTRKRKACTNDPLVKQLQKAQDRVVQKKAFNEVLLRRNLNNGKLKFGEIEKVVKEYNTMGFSSVTQRNLRYRLSLLDNFGTASMVTELYPPTEQIILPENAAKESGVTDVSPLTDEETEVAETLADLFVTNENENENNQTVSTRGQRKGSTNKAKEDHLRAIREATTKVAIAYNEAREKAIADGCNVAAGTLDNMIDSAIEEHGLPNGCIKKAAIISRLKRNNLQGVAHQKESPLKELEPILVEACIKMANIGMALKKEDVIELAMDFMEGTPVADKLKEFKDKRKLKSTDDCEKVLLEQVGTKTS